MGKNTKISWATHTFSTHWGCVEIPGDGACSHCYAREFSKRLGMKLWGKDAPRKQQSEHYWGDPLRWDRAAAKAGERHRVFCASMSDVFESRSDLDPIRARLWDLISKTPNLDWLLLTKRPENMIGMTPASWCDGWPSNVWAGTTAATQEWADKRIPILLRVPARVRWISAEPLLGPIDFSDWMSISWQCGGCHEYFSGPLQRTCPACGKVGYWSGSHKFNSPMGQTGSGLSWIIVGGESGHGSRLMEPVWAKAILSQCQRFKVPYFFKQKGEVLARQLGCKDKAGKDPSEWPAELCVQEFPVLA